MNNMHGFTQEEITSIDSWVIKFIKSSIDIEKDEGLNASIEATEEAINIMAKKLSEEKSSISYMDANIYIGERFAEISKKISAGAKFKIKDNITGKTHTYSVKKTNKFYKIIILIAIVVGIIFFATEKPFA